jgi:tetratricopeptide (TPR) repeat protein
VRGGWPSVSSVARVTRATLAICLCAAALTTCGEPRRPALLPIPVVDMAPIEPAVRDSIDQARANVDALSRDKAPNAQLADAYGELAMRYHVHDLEPPAEAAYENAMALAPRDKRWPYLLGHLYNDSARQAQAIAKFEDALSLDASDAPTMASLAEVSLKLGNLDRARTLYQRLLEVKDMRAVALAGLGKVALARRDYKAAISRLEECLALSPRSTRLRTPLAAAYRGDGRADKAEEVLHRFAPGGDEPNFPDPLASALDARIASSRGLVRRGERFAAAERFDLAAQAFRAASLANPADPNAFAELGVSLANLGQLDAAKQALNTSLRLNGGGAVAHLTLAVVLDREGSDEAAIANYRAALHADPGNQQAKVYLADALMRGGDIGGAAALYAEALSEAPSARVRLSLVLAEVRRHRFRVAKELLEKGLTESPNSPALNGALARVLATAPDPSVRDGPRALRIAASLFENSRDPGDGQTLAMAMAATGDFDHAIQLQEETEIAYERMGRPNAKPFLEQNLASYKAGRPASDPWAATDPLFQPRSPAVSRVQ